MIVIPEATSFSDTFAKVTAHMPIPDEFDYEYEPPEGTPLQELFITNLHGKGSRNHLEKHPTDKSKIGKSQSPMVGSGPYGKEDSNHTQKANRRK